MYFLAAHGLSLVAASRGSLGAAFSLLIAVTSLECRVSNCGAQA